MRSAVGRAIPTLMAALLLGSCGQIGSIPQPFQAPEDAKRGNALLTVPGAGGVFVATIEGPAGWVGEAFATAMAAALRTRGIVAGTRWANRDALWLHGAGYQQLHRDRPGELVMLWSLAASDGSSAGAAETRYTPPAGFWTEPTPEMFDEVAERMAVQVAAWVRGDAGADGAALPVRVAFLPPTGLPEERGAILLRELRRSLDPGAVESVRNDGSAQLLVQAQVAAAPLDAGTMHIAVAWIVTDGKGRELARVDQENVVDSKAFDDHWDMMARQIAGALSESLTAFAISWASGGQR